MRLARPAGCRARLGARRTIGQTRKALLASAPIWAVLVSSAAAQTSQDANAVEEVVVTATRVERSGYDAPTPTTVVGAELLEKRASLTLVDALTTLPAFRNMSTTGTATQAVASSAGQSFVNLRGLGPNRTLVLVDGQRIVPSSSQGIVDVAILPTLMLKRVDIVTGGASASWGSDAVAGVVNFVLDHDLKGFKASAARGWTDRGQGANWTGSLAYGGALLDDRLHIMAGGEYYENDGVEPGERPWARNQGDIGITPNPAFAAGNGQPRLLLRPNLYFTAPFYGMVGGTSSFLGTQFNPDGTLSATRYQFCSTPPRSDAQELCNGPRADRPYITKYSYLRAPQSRGSGYARVSYELTPELSLHADVILGRTKTRYRSGPPASPLSPGLFIVRNDNAFLPAALRAQLVAAGVASFPYARWFEDIGASRVSQQNETQRYTVGAEGKLFADWKFSAYYEYGQSDGHFRVDNLSITSKIAQAFDTVVGPTGAVVCRSTLTQPTNGCVPSNPFIYGARSPQELAYFMGAATSHLELVEQAAGLNVTGEPFSTWAGPVSVAFGAEYRKNTGHQVADPISQARGYALSNPQNLDGSLSVREVFGEAVVPLAKDVTFVDNLEVSVAARRTDYSFSGGVSTWKVGLNYSPIEDLRFRLTRSRDIRAPNILELYNAGTQSTAFVIDPRTRLSTPGFQAILNIGNLDLEPEIADTEAAGVVYRPGWLAGLSLSIDAYSIKIDDAISTLSLQQIVDRCHAGASELCALVTRTAAGAIVGIRSPSLNLRSFKAAGVDFDASYRFNLQNLNPGWDGVVGLRALVNRVYKFETGDAVSRIDQAGSILSGQPEWAADVSASYDRGPLSLNVTWVYTGGGSYDQQYIQGVDIDDNVVESVSYINAGLSYAFEIGGTRASYFLNADNIFDRGPPDEFPINGSNYDRVGRRFVTGIRLQY